MTAKPSSDQFRHLPDPPGDDVVLSVDVTAHADPGVSFVEGGGQTAFIG